MYSFFLTVRLSPFNEARSGQALPDGPGEPGTGDPSAHYGLIPNETMMARKVSGPTTRSPKKLAAAAHWPGAKHAQHKMNPSGNYFDKYRGQGAGHVVRRLRAAQQRRSSEMDAAKCARSRPGPTGGVFRTVSPRSDASERSLQVWGPVACYRPDGRTRRWESARNPNCRTAVIRAIADRASLTPSGNSSPNSANQACARDQTNPEQPD